MSGLFSADTKYHPLKRTDSGKNGGRVFCAQGLWRSHCAHFKLSLNELSCSAVWKTSTVNVPADYVKCCLKLPLTIRGAQVREELFN